MTYPDEPSEEMRVAFLRSLTILDTAQDINLDRIVTLCRQIFDVPIADISLIDKDRQWLKSEQGLGIVETAGKIHSAQSQLKKIVFLKFQMRCQILWLATILM